MPQEDPIKLISYSNRYSDENYEYRHVTLPKELARMVPRVHLMTESEWRNLGVQQSLGWVHYMIHQPACDQVGEASSLLSGTQWADSVRVPEPHILLFRRPKPASQPQ